MFPSRDAVAAGSRAVKPRDDNGRSVLVIVDPNFGEKLRTIPAWRPVWIAMSDVNEPIVRSLWKSRESGSHLNGITGFNFHGTISAEDRFLGELDMIDLHHGRYSTSAPYTEVEVVGARLTAEIRSALAELGFTAFAHVEDGFAARRSDEDAMR